MSKEEDYSVMFPFEHWDFGFLACFGFRASNFEVSGVTE